VSEPHLKPAATHESAPEETAYRVDDERVEAVAAALAMRDGVRVKELVTPLHYADVADLIERLGSDDRRTLIEVLRPDFDPEVLHELDDTVRDEVVEYLGVKELAAAVTELDSDDAVVVLEELDREEQQQVLESIPAEDRAVLEEALSYPEDSAGRLMQRELVSVPSGWTVGQTIDFMRQSADNDRTGENELPEVFYDIFVVDQDRRPVGTIPLSRLLRTRRPVPVTGIMETKMQIVPATMDQEDVAFLFRQRDLVSAPVVDSDGRLIGQITVDDVVDVIEEEAEEDIMKMAGVSETDLYARPVATARRRFYWLLINLGTAIVASLVIGLFSESLEKMVALAVLMPIVASMGGNAGTQTLAVVVRALATKELTTANALRMIGKELAVGSINGVLFALIAGAVAWIWFKDPGIGMVIAFAMIANLVVAGFAGSVIPLTLVRAGVDPAVASSVFLTTATDVVGFLVFLGLGTWLLL
jgi:magnesium transporter